MSVHNDGRARCLKVTRNGRVIRKRVDLITRVLCRARGEGWDFTRAIIRFAVGIRRRADERDGRFVDFQASLRSLLEIIKLLIDEYRKTFRIRSIAQRSIASR